MHKRASLAVIFVTVLVDLVGFGIVIPLVALYGAHFNASPAQLAVLGASFSIMQFIFAPFWGSLSDRIGRRPVLLVSLCGSTVSYLIFGLAPNYWWLLISRTCAGIFAANISAAQAYIADITPLNERARGMGLIGAAFGIGFTLGPPVGGVMSKLYGLGAPGLLAAAICGINLLFAYFVLAESYPEEKRVPGAIARRTISPLNAEGFEIARYHPYLMGLLAAFFLWTFAFSNVEVTVSLFLQQRLDLVTQEAAYVSGIGFMIVSLLAAFIQGGLIRRLVQKFGEWKLLLLGMACNAIGFSLFPLFSSITAYVVLCVPLALGMGLTSPCLSALVSKSVDGSKQGSVLGLSQGLGSLARALGPFFALLIFSINNAYPFALAALLSIFVLLVLQYRARERTKASLSIAGVRE